MSKPTFTKEALAAGLHFRKLRSNERWHREFLEAQLSGLFAAGFRPLLYGEVRQEGDQYLWHSSSVWIQTTSAGRPVNRNNFPTRTRRPMPD